MSIRMCNKKKPTNSKLHSIYSGQYKVLQGGEEQTHNDIYVRVYLTHGHPTNYTIYRYRYTVIQVQVHSYTGTGMLGYLNTI